jgi:hypothetical protein
MPKQQIEADIAEATENYIGLPVPIKHPLRPIQTNVPNVSFENNGNSTKETNIKDSAYIKFLKGKPTATFHEAEEILFYSRMKMNVSYRRFVETVVKGVSASGLEIVFDVWWFLNGKNRRDCICPHDQYGELKYLTTDVDKIPDILDSMKEFKIGDYKNPAEYTAIFMFHPQQSETAVYKVSMLIRNTKVVYFTLTGSYKQLEVDKVTGLVNLSKDPETKNVNIKSSPELKSPLKLILEQPYF